MYNFNIIIHILKVITPTTDSMIPLDFSQNVKYLIKFTAYDMINKFEVYAYQKMDKLYLT